MSVSALSVHDRPKDCLCPIEAWAPFRFIPETCGVPYGRRGDSPPPASWFCRRCGHPSSCHPVHGEIPLSREQRRSLLIELREQGPDGELTKVEHFAGTFEEYVPRRAAFIYLLVKAGVVVYVGQTFNLPSRAATHINTRRGLFDKLLYRRVDPEKRLIVESALIRLLRPAHNDMVPTSIRVEGDAAIVAEFLGRAVGGTS